MTVLDLHTEFTEFDVFSAWFYHKNTCWSSFKSKNHPRRDLLQILSGERLHFAMENHHAINGKIHYFYGKSPFLMGKSTISMAIFNSFL